MIGAIVSPPATPFGLAVPVGFGEKVRVVVKKVDRETGKIGLSARDLIESPWKRAGDKYHVGATVKGVVSRIAQFGAFVKLEPGVEGLVHISELADFRVRRTEDVVKMGEMIWVKCVGIDERSGKVRLSRKAAMKEMEAQKPGQPADAAPDAPAAPAN